MITIPREVMTMDMWNEKLTRENITDFYNSTVEMAYPAVFGITKEPARTERVIIKTYLDTYQQRSVLKGEDVIYTFGDILLKNANEEVEKFPLPENIAFAERYLDEYSRNFMLERIIMKIDSTGYKVAEFISSDAKKAKPTKSIQKVLDLFPVTPLLIFQLILLAIVVWVVSSAAVSVPYRNDPLISPNKIFEDSDLQAQYVGVLPYYPLYVNFPGNALTEESEQTAETIPSEDPLTPITHASEPSATRG